MFGKRKVSALVAEFLGTFFLVSFVLAMLTQIDFGFFAALSAGLLWMMATLAMGGATGVHLNPAVTLGLWTLRKVQTTQAVVYIAVQMLAAFLAFHMLRWLMNTELQDAAVKLIDWRIFTAEVLGGLLLGVGVAAAIYRAYDGAKFAAMLGLSLLLAMVMAGVGGNGLVNPAVALGINSFSLTYVLGPLVGVVLGMNLYAWLFADGVRVRRAVAATPTKAPVVKAKTTKKKR